MKVASVISGLESLVLTAWVGALWTIGFIAAPILFTTLDDRATAGAVAARWFALVAVVGIWSGAILLSIQVWRERRAVWRAWRAWVLVVMLGLTAFGAFGLAPAMRALKAENPARSEALAQTQFRRLHGMSSSVYTINCVLGALLVAAGMRRTTLER